jgi:hypothetical protein
MVSTRNAIARQIDPTDPQSMMRGIQALQQAGDQVGAMQLAAVYQQRMKVLADIGQSEAAAASSRAATGKTLAETSELQARVAERDAAAKGYFGGAAGQPGAMAQPAAAVESAPAPYFNESVIADLPARVQNDIRTVLGDAAQLRNIPEDELRSVRATARLKSADALDRQAASMLAVTQRLARGFGTPAETQEVDAALALLRPPQAAPAAPATPAAAAAAPSRAEASEDRLAVIQRRLETIRRARAAGVKAAEIEGKELEDEQKALREAAKPTEIERLIARREQLIAGGAQPDNSALQAISGRIANLQGREVRFGEQREAYAADQFGKPFAQLTQAQQKVINDRVDAESSKPRTTITNVLPEQQIPAKDWIKFEEFVEKQPTFKQTAAMISAAPGVLRVIRQSTSNDFASRALPTSIAKLFDQGTLSNQDVSRYARTGGLDDRLASMASEFFTGRVTSVTKEQAERFMSAVYRGALIDQRNIYVKQADRLGYADSPNYAKTLKQIDDELAKFREVQPAPSPGVGAAPGAGGRSMSPQDEDALLRKYGQTPR